MKVVDLSVVLYDGLVSFPSHPKVVFMDHVTHDFSKPRYQAPCEGYASKTIIMSDHSGTHMDAPYHFFKDGWTIEQIPVEATMGNAVLVDVSQKSANEPVTRDLVEEVVRRDNLKVKKDDIVLFRCWPGVWNAAGFHDCLSLDPSVASWVVEQKVKAIGLDLPNADINTNMQRNVHMELLGRNIMIFENVVNLEKLTKKHFYFMGTPLNLKGMTGSPIRALAIEEW
ncbi:cyclase family protein [Cytobacillus sp. FSL W7-1323]|uniref:cyclase family protein n=1 Tax=unclassified Cytobacillus TaxID=2675268 RepID=UPI002AFF210D|nr:cyclase family protein [Cytobacillus sp. OWB-43]MEA1853963.1 cyclase family protein [Cytobacillus sp. OWB-43]